MALNVYEFNIAEKYGNLPLYARTTESGRRSLKAQNLSIGEIETRIRSGKGFNMPTHIHAPVEIHYIREGSMTVCIGDMVRAVSAGEVLIVNPYQRHGFYLASTQEHVVHSFIVFEPGRFGITGMKRDKVACQLDDWEKGELMGVNFLADSERTRRIGALICEMSEAFARQDGNGIVEHRMAAAIQLLFSELLEGGCLERGRQGAESRQFSRQLLEFLDGHYDEDITSEQIGQLFAYHPSYFCRLFKQTFGVPFRQYLAEYRIQRAIFEYLNPVRNPGMNISEIAVKVGFSDVNYFSRVFKRYTGMTPSEYRRRKNK